MTPIEIVLWICGLMLGAWWLGWGLATAFLRWQRRRQLRARLARIDLQIERLIDGGWRWVEFEGEHYSLSELGTLRLERIKTANELCKGRG